MSKSRSVFKVAYVPGDDAGPEVMYATIKVLEKALSKFPNLTIELVHLDIGFERFQKSKDTFDINGFKFGGIREEDFDILANTDAMLYTAIANGNFSKVSRDILSPWFLVKNHFKLFVDIRKGKSFPNAGAQRDDIDFVLVRDQSEGLFRLAPEFMSGEGTASVTVSISRKSSEIIARIAFEIARSRDKSPKKVSCAHKVPISPKMFGTFRDSCQNVSREFPDIVFEEVYTDLLPYVLIKNPSSLDVIVTTNFYGDVISGIMAAIVGTLGIFPGALYGDNYAVFKPSHGTAPKYIGKDKINPCASILSAAMMLEWLGMRFNNKECLKAACYIEKAVYDQLKEGKVLTADMGGKAKTSEFSNSLVSRL